MTTRGDGDEPVSDSPSQTTDDSSAETADDSSSRDSQRGGTESEGTSLDDEQLRELAARDWRAALAATGEIVGPIAEAIIETHGDRGQRAVEAVAELRVKQYRDFTVVVGHHEEHVVEDGGCDCADAAYNLDPENPEDRCWHAIAVDIAERVGAVDHHDMWYSEVREFL